MQTIKNMIQREGFYMSAAKGSSMLPLIRPNADTIVIEKITGECQPMDIVLYQLSTGKLVLHRILKVTEKEYLICGDNCVALEHIPKDYLIGKLTGLYRKEKKIDLKSFRYCCYVKLWCRPYAIRIFILKAKMHVKRFLKKGKDRLFRK